MPAAKEEKPQTIRRGHYARISWSQSLTTVPLLIIDDFGMRKLPLTWAATATRA
jgi:hypothetical protein